MSLRALPVYEFSEFRLEPRERRLLRRGQPVALPPKAFDLLVFLVSRDGHLVTKEEILEAVWAGTFVEEANLSYTVSLLRKALDDNPAGSSYIETVPRLGYRFTAGVRVDGADVTAAPGSAAAGEGLETVATTAPGTRGLSRRSLWFVAVAVVGVVLVAGAAATLWPAKDRRETRAATRFEVALPRGFMLTENEPPAVSPDGRLVALVGRQEGRPQLWVRALDSSTLTPLTGTEGAVTPFWSPDSRRLGFIQQGELKAVNVSGGPIATIYAGADATKPHRRRNGTWNRQGLILFAHEDGRIHEVSERGGPSRPVTEAPSSGSHPHRQPSFLPDGRRFLYTRGDIYVASVDSSEVKLLVERASHPRYASGFVFFLIEQQRLMALPFDPAAAEPRGEPVTVVERLAWRYSVSDSGTVIASQSNERLRQMVWFSRDGRRGEIVGRPDRSSQVELAPDDTRVMVDIATRASTSELWLVDLSTHARTLAVGPAESDQGTGRTVADPAWSPDGRRIAFTSRRTGLALTIIKDLVTGHEVSVDGFPGPALVEDWTTDGETIVVRISGSHVTGTALGIYALRAHETRSWRKLANPPGTEDQLQVSPDGRWVAFNSNVSGDWEVYVTRFPDFSDTRQVSTAGGMQPRWRVDGRELFYLAPDASLVAVPFDVTGLPPAGPPRPLFRTWLNPAPDSWQYDVARDGRFLVLEQESGTEVLTILLEWPGRTAS